MQNQLRNRSAFTLVELLMVLAVSALLLTATCSVLLAASNSARSNDSVARSRLTANNTLNYILTKVRRAKQIDFKPDTPPYTTLITLDEGTWVTALNDYDPTTCIWTQIKVNGDRLQIGSGNTTTPSMQNVLGNIQGMAITATKGSDGRYHEITVQLTIAAPDAFSGAKSTSFAVSGTTMCRSAGPAPVQ